MSKELQKWADKAMFESEPIDTDIEGRIVPQVYLLSATPDPLGSLAAACMMYEGKVVRNLFEVNDDQRRHYWEQVKKTHLRAPMEYVSFHFLLEGVTRSFTHQMVRQRTAVYSQESLRFAVKENLSEEVPLPPSIKPGSLAEIQWEDAIDAIDAAYTGLIDAGVPAEDARGLLPHSTTTRLHYHTNLRNLLDHAGNRLCTQAQFEWRYAFTGIVAAIRDYDPYEDAADWREQGADHQWQFELMASDGLFKPVCYKLGHCPFTADFDRGCTIRDRVQEGKFEEIDDKEWLMDPKAGITR